MATCPSNLAWKIPGIEEPGRLQAMELQRVRHERLGYHVVVILIVGSRERSG